MRAKKYIKHAKPLKKQTKNLKRQEDAKQRAKLFTVAAILFSQAESTVRLNEVDNKEKKQLKLIEKWSLKVIDAINKRQPLGHGVMKKGYERGDLVDKAIESRMPTNKISIDNYVSRWIAFSLIADDARLKAGGTREWNFLAGCVATWVNMLMKQAKDPDKAEEFGGELGEIAWNIILR